MATAETITAAYHSVWVDLARASGSPVETDDEMILVSTGTPAAAFNRAFVTSDPEDPAAAIDRARRFFGPLPFLFETRDLMHPRAQEASVAMGLPEAGVGPGMLYESIDTMALHPGAPDLRIVEATSDEERARNLAVQAEGFGAPIELLTQVFGSALSIDRVRCFTGWVDATPVATSIVVVGDGLAGVYAVATIPEARGRGYGESMSAHALRVAAQDQACRAGYLQASPMGLPIYERMGFRTVTTYRSYLCEAPDALGTTSQPD